MFFNSRAVAATILAVLLLCFEEAASHSWVDLVETGGQKGYIRGWEGRSIPQVDIRFSYLIEEPRLHEKPICKDSQQYPVNSPSYPRLKARPGDLVISSHFENGHVTLLQAADSFSGIMYWFGTRSPDPKTTFGEVVAWTGDSQGGTKKGTLIGANPYDDGVCAESNDSPLSAQRGVGPGRFNKACKGSFKLPSDLKPGDTYTVYWVWDFSWHFGVNKPRREEWYTSCMDIDII